MQYGITHTITFEADRDSAWPDKLPWPEWKPETDKYYRPDLMTFTVSWTHGERAPSVASYVNIIGYRILKSGNTGSDVKCSYYGDGLNKLPQAMHELLHRALQVAHAEKEKYERPEQALATAVPGEVP